MNSDTIIFLPDEYLAKNVAAETGKHIIFPSKFAKQDSRLDFQMIGWEGRCEVHEQFELEDINKIREQFDDVVVLAHPECSPEIVRFVFVVVTIFVLLYMVIQVLQVFQN